MSTAKLEERIVGVERTSKLGCDTMAFHQLGIHLNFQRPRCVLQDKTIICWLNVAGGNSEKFLAKRM